MPLQEDYRVSLDLFEGPLDLLLFLIRRAEVDIHDIPVAIIADQYLAFLRQIEDIDVELAGEFLVMAATLVELKSRTLVPTPAEDDEGAGDEVKNRDALNPADPRFELVKQLLAYQRFRIAADELDLRRQEFAQRYALRPGSRNRPSDDDDETGAIDLELEDLHVLDLAANYERIIESIDFARLGDHVVEMDDTPVALYQEDLLDRLRSSRDGRLTLQSTFLNQEPPQRIGFFLATLELVRLRRVNVEQEDIDREIEIVLRSDEENDFAREPAPTTN